MSAILDTVTVTGRAAQRIARIVSGDAAAGALRVSVEGGGCSGFSYRFELAPGPDAEDLVIERDGATVVIDQVSLPFMAGAEIDFVDDLMGQSFQVKNPNATASCGCGRVSRCRFVPVIRRDPVPCAPPPSSSLRAPSPGGERAKTDVTEGA